MAIIASARQTNEELFLLRKLAERLGALTDCIRREGEADRLLVHADKNPNTTGARLNGICFTEVGINLAKIAAGIADGTILTLLVFGGSLGARFLNQVVPGVLADNKEVTATWRIIHQTGENDFDAVCERYRDTGLNVEICPFLYDMGKAYGEADLALCRAGASTLAELAAVGLPSVLVPFPNASHDHQTKNAQLFADSGAAVMIKQTDQEAPARLAETRRAWWARHHRLCTRRLASAMRRSRRWRLRSCPSLPASPRHCRLSRRARCPSRGARRTRPSSAAGFVRAV